MDPNWHGRTAGFSKVYQGRFFEDRSMEKAHRDKVKTEREEEKNYRMQRKVQEHEKFKKRLEEQKKKELEKKNRLKQMIQQHQALQIQMENAALTIQRYTRGYLVRRAMKDFLTVLSKKKLERELLLLDYQIETCWKHLGNATDEAARNIQRVYKGYIVRRNVKATFIACVKLQRFFRKIRLQRIEQERKFAILKSEMIERIFQYFKWAQIRNYWMVYKENIQAIREEILQVINLQRKNSIEEFHENLLQMPEIGILPPENETILKENLALVKFESMSSQDNILKNEVTIQEPTLSLLPPQIKDFKKQTPKHEVPRAERKFDKPPKPPSRKSVEDSLRTIRKTDEMPKKKTVLKKDISRGSDDISAWKNNSGEVKVRAQTAPKRYRDSSPGTSSLLKPTQAYLSRTKLEEEEDRVVKKGRYVRGKRFQQETKSREIYRNEKKDEKVSLAPVQSWRARMPSRNTQYYSNSMLPQPHSQPEIKHSPSPFQHFTKEDDIARKEEIDDKLEESDGEPTERIFVYRPPSAVTYQFKQALPELYELVQTYGMRK